MFFAAKFFNQDLPWDLSAVTDASRMFAQEMHTYDAKFNGDVSSFFPAGSAVTNTTKMFSGAKVFNRDLPWDLSAVTDAFGMFYWANIFNGNVSSFFPSGSVVNSTKSMFHRAYEFNQDLPWDLSTVTDASIMFAFATKFNGDISSFFPAGSVVTSTRAMFKRADVFNQDLPWDLSTVMYAFDMFAYAYKFNGDVSSFFPAGSAVTSTRRMFKQAWEFNQDISDWELCDVFTQDMFDSTVRLSKKNRPATKPDMKCHFFLRKIGSVVKPIFTPARALSSGDSSGAPLLARPFMMSVGVAAYAVALAR